MKKKIVNILLIVVILLGLSGCGQEVKDTNKPVEKISDAEKFKNEYEALNDTKNSDDKEHRSVSIDKENPIVYSDAESIIEMIDNEETFYVYFGSQYCPWCRSVIEKMLEVAKVNDISKIYYVNIWDGEHKEILRDTYELDENNKVVLKAEGTNEYKILLEKLNNVLEDYTLTTKNGKSVKVGEKRIFAPNFIYIENGKATKIETGISKNQKDSREELSDKILKDEEEKFTKFFEK